MKTWLQNPYFLSGLDGRRLELILFPTEKCNFRCTYCYEDFKIGEMSADVVEGICSLITNRSQDLNMLAISWFGGEPLMARGVIDAVMGHARDVAHGTEMTIASSMTTNGWYLDRPTLEHLTGLGVTHFQISLDGLDAVHDATRRHISGSGTFDRIWSNLEAAHKSALPFDFLLRVHTHPRNETALMELVAKASIRFGTDARFKVMFQPVEELGQSAAMDLFTAEQARAVAERLQDALAEPLRHVDPFADQYVCYASRPNSFCIRADGRVGKCTVALHDDRNTVGRIDRSGALNLDHESHRKWFAALGTLDPEALACPYSVMRQQDRLSGTVPFAANGGLPHH